MTPMAGRFALQEAIESLATKAGITINGPKPWDPHVHDERFYARVLREGSLGLGESYMDGWWDCDDLEEFVFRIIRAGVDRVIRPWRLALLYLRASLCNLQTKRGSRRVARQHYDLPVSLYTSFLDSFNQYTCGYFEGTDDLEVAQQQKLDLICQKLQLTSSDRVLDIGCGWGGFARYASERYGCHVTGVTISDAQVRYAQEFCKGLPVTITQCDYRDVEGTFDKVLVCGMIEHVGWKNYRRLFEVVRRCLRESGTFLLHTIGGNTRNSLADPWITKYIFPNSMVPSLAQLTSSFSELFVLEDLQNFGTSYVKTLRAWCANFQQNWGKRSLEFDERFRRMFTYYFLSCAGAFRARSLQLWQFVLSPKGVLGGYRSPLLASTLEHTYATS